jgi:hypothetical protein
LTELSLGPCFAEDSPSEQKVKRKKKNRTNPFDFDPEYEDDVRDMWVVGVSLDTS